MANLPEDGDEGADGKPARSLARAAATLVALTVVAAGAGTLAGFQLVENVEAALTARAETEQAPPPPAPHYGDDARLYALPPVVTNLASPPDVWVRLDASIVLDDAATDSAEVLTARIAEDVLAYLRTVTLAQLQGPSGLLYLREDLSDRVAIRSNDQVRELIIETLVVQ